MTTFKYRGISPDGEKVSGIIKAYNEYEAVAQLGDTCPVITNIHEVKETRTWNRSLGGLKIKDKDLAIICSQFAIILTAGLPIVRCVEMVAQQARTKELRAMLLKVADDVSSGYTLSQGFENNCKTLPVTFIETIRAGEQSGTLEVCFQRLHQYFDNASKTKAKIISTLTYPAMVVVVGIIVFIIVMVTAVPMFVSTFQELDVELPSITKAMIATSDFIRNRWWVLVLIAMVIGLVSVLVRRNPKGRALLDRRKLKWSPLRKLHSMNAASQFASTMSTMLAAGVPIVRSLEITANVITNGVVSQAVMQARQGVEQGRSLTECMAESQWFPQMLTEMTGVGEQSGNLEGTLNVIADYFNNEVMVLSQRLLSILEPVITILIAVFTVMLLLGIYLPMFTMYGSVI